MPSVVPPASDDPPPAPPVPPAPPASGDQPAPGEPASTVKPKPATEKVEPDAAASKSSPPKERVEKVPVAVSATMAAHRDEAFREALRENLIGTLADWSRAGLDEVARVRGLLAEHRDWTAEEREVIRSAFTALADAASASPQQIVVAQDIRWLDEAPALLEELGHDPADIFDLNPATGNVVMRDGALVELGR